MGENKEMTKAPQSILGDILDETFQKLEDEDDFNNEIVFQLKCLASEDSLLNESKLIAILRGESQ